MALKVNDRVVWTDAIGDVERGTIMKIDAGVASVKVNASTQHRIPLDDLRAPSASFEVDCADLDWSDIARDRKVVKLGGKNPDGTRWTPLPVADVAAKLNVGADFYVSDPNGHPVNLFARREPEHGVPRDVVSTARDHFLEDNLRNLKSCP